MPPDFTQGFLDGVQAAAPDVSDEAARQLWIAKQDQFRTGQISPDYWFGYQNGQGKIRRKPGYPRI
jgi:hypothetical protein